METDKYGRTYHFPFSPGTTSDDRISYDWEMDIEGKSVVITEKLDGSNTSINIDGVFGRSHASPTRNPWDEKIWEIWKRIKNDLGSLEIFGENMYAIHSITYDKLTSPLYIFAVRDNNEKWLSWEEVKFYSGLLDLPTVPVLGEFNESIPTEIKDEVLRRSKEPSVFGPEREGLVVRNTNSFTKNEFRHKVFKWVRKSHVSTDQHWTRSWKKADINY